MGLGTTHVWQLLLEFSTFESKAINVKHPKELGQRGKIILFGKIVIYDDPNYQAFCILWKTLGTSDNNPGILYMWGKILGI